MSLSDRIVPLCDLLLGAAYADKQFKDREREEVTSMLAELAGEMTPAIEKQISNFDPEKFDLAKTAAAFLADDEDERRRLLFLVAAINDADDEVDFAEDEYLRNLAAALKLPPSALEGMVIEVEIEERKGSYAKVTKATKATPPPPPGSKPSDDDDVEVDVR